mmetsp:Transcript_22258/g.34382  ORF Transcript_22258/g.34382 Transcript_22258/m.34382 type:complete len:1367 (+) Transcript_22258:2215-6315(+)
MTDESNKKRKAASELPMPEATKSVLFTKIDVDSDETPTLKKGVRSVKACSHGGRRKKQIAEEFPPDIVQTVRLALFQQTETLQCGANLVRNLTAQNLIPPESIARELMDVIKSFHYKNPLRTTFAGLHASALVSASARLVRRNGSAIFGPSSWNDVEVLLSHSTDRAVFSSGIRLTHELQAAACGAKLLSLLLKTELLDFNLSSTDFDFNSEPLRARPTVAVLKKQGLRNVLKTATRHATKCLVRHAKYLLDSDVDMPPSSHPNHVACCAAEAKTCLDNLGSVICYTAWLLCAEERVSIEHNSSAFVIRDAFLSELSLCDDTLPIMNSKKKKMFITKLKLHFLLSILEEFAFPLQDAVGNLIGLEVELDGFGEEDAKQEGDDVPEVVNVDCGSANQLDRKSSAPILVQRQNELVEAYELENKDSSLFWVEFVSDGKCVAVSSDRIFRGRKRKPRPSKRPTYKKDPQLLSRGKSSRFLNGDKITPLGTGIIKEDLCQMETYDKACKRFRIESFNSRNHVEVAGCNCTDQLVRKSIEPVLVQRQNEEADPEPDNRTINDTITSAPSTRRLENGQSLIKYVPGQGKLAPTLEFAPPEQLNLPTQRAASTSLGVLCQSFMELYKDAPPNRDNNGDVINIVEVADHFGVKRGKMYDIINVLESIDIVARVWQSTYRWHGTGHLPKFFAKLQRDAIEEQTRKDNGTWAEDPNKPKTKVVGTICHKLLRIFLSTGHLDFTLAYAADNITGPAASAVEEAARAAQAAARNPITLPNSLALPPLQADPASLPPLEAPMIPDNDGTAVATTTDGKTPAQTATKTKIVSRRIYDVVNILQALGILTKYNVGPISENDRPSLKWTFYLKPDEITQYGASSQLPLERNTGNPVAIVNNRLTLNNNSEPGGGTIKNAIGSEPEGETINCAIAKVTTPTHLEDDQSSKFDISGQGKLSPALKVHPFIDVPATNIQARQFIQQQLKSQQNRLQQQQIYDPNLPTMFAASQVTPQVQLTPRQNHQPNYEQLDKHMATVASFLEKNSIGKESWQSCRYCQQSFYIAPDGLSRHEMTCPLKIEVQQSPQQLQLQHNQLQEELQQQGQSFPPYLPTPFVATQDATSSLADHDFNLTSQQSLAMEYNQLAPATDMMQVPNPFTTYQEATQEQLTFQQNPQRQQNYQQLDFTFPENTSIEGESWQSCRYCQQSFYSAAGGLSRHEMSCPAKVQVQQFFQQEPRNELQHNQLQGQFQLQQQQQNFVSYLPTPFPFAPTYEPHEAQQQQNQAQLLDTSPFALTHAYPHLINHSPGARRPLPLGCERTPSPTPGACRALFRDESVDPRHSNRTFSSGGGRKGPMRGDQMPIPPTYDNEALSSSTTRYSESF